MDSTKEVRKASNLTYTAQVLRGGITARPFDGYVLKLTSHRQSPVETRYWMLDGAVPRWIDASHQIEVASLNWPRIAYEIATHVQEAEAREALEVAIREMVQSETRPPGT